MKVTVRELKANEFNIALSLWNECRPSDPITARVFKRKVILDVNFDRKGYLIAECDGKPVGYIYTIIRKAPIDNDGSFEEGVAVINGFGVLRGLENEVGPELVSACEDYAKENGIKKLLISPYKPYYFTQGFDLEREAHYVNLFLSLG